MTTAQVAALLRNQPTVHAFRFTSPPIIVRTASDNDTVIGLAAGSAAAGKPSTIMAGASGTSYDREDFLHMTQVPEPSEQIQREFLGELERAQAPLNFTYNASDVDRSIYRSLSGMIGNSAVTDLEVVRWEIFKSSISPQTFRLKILVRARFYRPADNTLLWEETSECATPEDPNGPSLERLKDANGLLARQKFQALALECAGMLARAFLVAASPEH